MQNRKDRWQYIIGAVLMMVLALAMLGIIEPCATQAANFGSLTDNGTAAYMGVGIAVPVGPLHIYSTTSTQPETIELSGNGPLTAQWNNWGPGGSASGTGFLARFSRGTKASPVDVVAGDRLGFNVFGGMAGGVFKHTAAIEAVVGSGTVSSTSLPTYMRFLTTPAGSTSRLERLRIDPSGRVGINTTTPDTSSKLNVVNDNTTYPNLAVYGTTTGGNTSGVGGTNDGLNSLGMVGGSYNQEGTNYGVGAYGTNTLYGTSGSLGTPNEGVYGYADNTTGRNAGYFKGNIYVDGVIAASGAKEFKIDDPLDPNKYLIHASVESPGMMNMYNGSIVLDSKGEAVVQLPAYFGALNKDFQYQLTCIGSPAVVYVKNEIVNNSFTIAGDKPGVKVSWQVTGIRHDAWANAHPFQVEVPKIVAASGAASQAVKSSSGNKGWADWSKLPAMSK